MAQRSFSLSSNSGPVCVCCVCVCVVCVHTNVCMHTCVCVIVCVIVYTNVCMHTCTRMRTCVCVRGHARARVCVCKCAPSHRPFSQLSNSGPVCMTVCTQYACAYVNVCTSTFTHTHTHVNVYAIMRVSDVPYACMSALCLSQRQPIPPPPPCTGIHVCTNIGMCRECATYSCINVCVQSCTVHTPLAAGRAGEPCPYQLHSCSSWLMTNTN